MLQPGGNKSDGQTDRCTVRQTDRQIERDSVRLRTFNCPNIGGWLRHYIGIGEEVYCGSRRRRRVVADGVRISQMDAATAALGP